MNQAITTAVPVPVLPPREARGGRWMVPPLLAVVVVLLFRQTFFFIRPQFWAEDATVLFTQARLLGWHALYTPYPSYYILGQRLVAFVAAQLPSLYAPWIYTYGALAYTLLTAWFCLRARLGYLVDQRGKIALALALVLAPQGGEVMLKLIGSQWILMAILPILALQESPTRRWDAIVDFGGLFLAGLTGPYMTLFAPWFLLRLRRVAGGWSRYNVLFVMVAGTLATLQLLSILNLPLPGGPFTRDPHQWSKGLGFVMPGCLFFGDSLPNLLGRAFYVISPLLLSLLGWALWHGEARRRWAVLALCGCGAVAYAGGVRMAMPNITDLNPFYGGTRYFVPLYVFAMWTAVIYWHDGSARLRAASAVAAGLMLLSSATHFKGEEMPNYHWRTYTAPLDAGEEVPKVPILPNLLITFPAVR